jgi:xanthine/CO dehydrogenase XdhC/CoxF family maturation factor
MDRHETERLLNAIRQVRALGEPAAVATVVRVRGSAYRREGTRMLVRQDGTYECALSGGCLEPAVAEAAARVIATGEPSIVSYDLADDSIWGLGIGCAGAVDIRIERIENDAISHLWLEILEQGKAAVLVTPLSGVSGRTIVTHSGEVAGGLTDPVIHQMAIAQARERLAARYPQSGTERTACADMFFEIAIPPPDLVIFGAGDDVGPVVKLAWMLGLAVTVVDAREKLLTPDRFPCAALVSAHHGHFAKRVSLGSKGFALIMNHHIERDRESLRFCLESNAADIGVLGPRARYDKLLAGLAGDGYVPDASKLSRVRSPVGLSLGAETPTEIAVSILAEVLALQRGFQGGFLTGSAARLHRPEEREENRLLASS